MGVIKPFDDPHFPNGYDADQREMPLDDTPPGRPRPVAGLAELSPAEQQMQDLYRRGQWGINDGPPGPYLRIFTLVSVDGSELPLRVDMMRNVEFWRIYISINTGVQLLFKTPGGIADEFLFRGVGNQPLSFTLPGGGRFLTVSKKVGIWSGQMFLAVYGAWHLRPESLI